MPDEERPSVKDDEQNRSLWAVGRRVNGSSEDRRFPVLRRGIEAGVLASVPQVLVAKAEERLFLPEDETADVGPRFVVELAERAERRLPEDVKWLAASTFHFGYAAGWGALYALCHERWPVPPVAGGLTLAGVIWTITFPRWGAAVLMGSEREPRERSWGKELVLASAALVFGLGTALLYGRGPADGRHDADPSDP